MKTEIEHEAGRSLHKERIRQLGKVLDELTEYATYLQEQGVITIEASKKIEASAKNVERELDRIAQSIADCSKCSLHQRRRNTVPGQGSIHPDIMFVGEGPGQEEDSQGIPFVGKSGQLLTRMISRMGYQRHDVFISNIVKCRPPNNRKPFQDEMEACLPYLKAQIALLKPKVIITLGATALEGLVSSPVKITRQRGTWMTFENIPLMPTFHPSYLLRNPSASWNVWDDMLAVLKYLGRKPLPARK